MKTINFLLVTLIVLCTLEANAQIKNRYLVLGQPSSMAKTLSQGKRVSTKPLANIMKIRGDQPVDLVEEKRQLKQEILGSDALLVNANQMSKGIMENVYIQSALENHVPIVFENLSAKDMASITGIGINNAEAVLIQSKKDGSGYKMAIIANDVDAVLKSTQETASNVSDNALTAEEKNKMDRTKVKESDFTTTPEVPSNITARKMTQKDVADLIERSIIQSRNNIGRPGFGRQMSVNPNVSGFEFSKTGIDFSIRTVTWTSDGQSMSYYFDFDVQLVAAVSPLYRKYVRIKPKSVSYFDNGSPKYNGWTNKGYYQDKCEIGIGYANRKNNFKIDRKAPNNTVGATTYSKSTGFTVGANVGASKDGPSSGMNVSYSESNSQTHTIPNFSMVSTVSGENYVRFKMNSNINYGDYFDWRWTGTPLFSSRQYYVKNLPGGANAQITPECDATFTAPGNYYDNETFKIDILHQVRRLVVTKQEWPSAWRNWPGYTHTRSFNLVVNFSKVTYPHMAIDERTEISAVYPYSGGDKSRAVDGYTKGVNAAAIARWGTNSYIDVILPRSKYIYDIDIWDSDVYRGYLRDFYVFISETPFTSTDPEVTKRQTGVDHFFQAGQSPKLITKWATNRQAKYIRLQRKGTGYLVVGEIAVNPRRNE